jgi:hypothetical protein
MDAPRSLDGVSVVGVVAFEERGDGVTVYHIKLSNGEVLKRRYNDIRKMFDKLPEHEKKRLHLTFPGKTGLRKANDEDKNKRLAAFDRLMKTISDQAALNSSPAFHAFLSGEKMKKAKGEKGKKDDKKKHGFKKMTRKDFKETEIESFDTFFEKLKEPLDTVNDLSENLADAHDSMAECFKEPFVVSAGIVDGDLKGLITYYMVEIKKAAGDVKMKVNDDFEPKIKFKGKHAKHVETFIEALTTLITAVTEFVSTAPDLIEQIAELATECQDFPMKVKDEAPSLSPMKIPGAIKKTTDNVRYVGGVPGEFKEFFENVKQLLTLLEACITETFGIAGDGDF